MEPSQTPKHIATLKKENEELKDRIALLTDFIEHGAVPLHSVNADGIITWVNQAELDLLGYSRDEYLGKPITDFHQDPTMIQELFKRVLNHETLSDYPATLICKDGTLKYVVISSNGLFKDDQFIHSRCFTKDVTALVIEEERRNNLLRLLEKSEERLRLAIEATELGTWDWNIQQGKIYLSTETRSILNLDDDILDPDHILELVHPADRREVNFKIEKLKDDLSERPFNFICRIIRPNLKTTSWIKIQGSTHFNAQQRLRRIIGSVLDITELKVAETKNKELVAIVNSSNDAIIGKSLDGIITSWNNAAQELFGFAADEMIGQSNIKLLPNELKDEEDYILMRLRNGESLKHFETKRLTKSGKTVDVSLTFSPIRNDQGAIVGISKIARDITDKKLEERRKNDFISMVSHELKTPLTSVLLFTQILQKKFNDTNDEIGLQMTAKIENQTKKMTSLIRDFLSLARIEEGKLQVNLEPISLLALFDEIKNEAELLINKHHISFLCESNIIILADRDKMGQVFMNLLSNAIKYSPDGGTITLGCEEVGDKIKLYVQDEGIGIDLADQKKLFNRFYRVDSEQTSNISGFGIGLYIVSEILRYHQSTIEVSSEKGVGTTFYFFLDLIHENRPERFNLTLC
ncbi:PAS domain S-box protein [Sphingobacterium faecium]|uniref:PAS domain-containing sensor histidine kinase n=1 Tax=Sphingobacterium faecium TaxID=34087 RepID=UPI003209D4BE